MLSFQRAVLRAGLIFAIVLRVEEALTLSADDASSIKVSLDLYKDLVPAPILLA